MKPRHLQCIGILAAGLVATLAVNAEPAAGADPLATVRHAFNAVESNQPDRLWDLLPASYQHDMQALMVAFATTADADTWNRVRNLLARFSRALDKQNELVFGAVAQRKPMTDAEAARLREWIAAVSKLSGYLAVNPITDRERWQQGRLRDLLAVEGRALIVLLQTLSESMPDADDNLWQKTRDANVELLSIDGDEASVRVTIADDEDDITLKRVEGRWIPAEMAENWQQTAREMQQQIADMDPATPEGRQGRMQTQMVLGMIDGMLTHFEQAESEDELAQIVNSLLMFR